MAAYSGGILDWSLTRSWRNRLPTAAARGDGATAPGPRSSPIEKPRGTRRGRQSAKCARRPRAVSHRAGAPLKRGGGGGSEVLAACSPILALGRSSKQALHRASREARSARRLRHPHHPQETMRNIGTCRRLGVQRPRLRFRARSARQQSGCRRPPGARSAHAIGAERVARGGAGSQLLPRAGRPTRSRTPSGPGHMSLGGYSLLAQNPE